MKLVVILLSTGAYLGAGLAFATQALIARLLTPESYGVFSAALSSVMLLAPLAGFGIGMFWLKVFGEEGWQGMRWLKPSLISGLLTTSLTVGAVFFWALYAPHTKVSVSLLMILSFCIIGQFSIELANSVHQLEERYSLLAAWQFLPHFMRFSFLLFLWAVVGEDVSVIDVAWVYFGTAGIMIAAGCVLMVRVRLKGLYLVGHKKHKCNVSYSVAPNFSDVLSQAWPFGVATAFHLIYFQGGVVLAKYLVDDSAAGKYSLAVTMIMAVYLFPSVIYQKLLLPKIHRWATNDVLKLMNTYRKGNYLMLATGLLFAGLLYFLAPAVVPLMFGDKYSDVVNIVQVLAISIPLRFVATSAGSVLSARDQMKTKVMIMGAVALVNILFSFILVDKLGIAAIMVSLIISEALLLVLYLFWAKAFMAKLVV